MEYDMDFSKFLNDRYPITKPASNGGVKLPVVTVKSVKKMLHEGIAPKVIAIDLNININNVYNIKNGYTHRKIKWE